jgi:acyl carrier protein
LFLLQAVYVDARTLGIRVAKQHAKGAAHAWAKVLSLEMPQANIRYTEGSFNMLALSDAWGTRQHGAPGVLQRPILLKRPSPALPTTSHSLLQAPSSPFRAAITGGLGALGTLVARSLVVSTPAPIDLLLLGRSARLGTTASFATASTPASNAMVTITKLDGASINDISSFCDINALRVIHHASGVLKDAAIRSQTLGNVRSSAASKTYPVQLLLTKTAATMPISHHIAYGSIASSLGSAGQLPYAMANSDLEGIVMKSAAQGIQSINIAWGAWGAVGMAANNEVKSKLNSVGILTLKPEIGLSIIHRLLIRNGRGSSTLIAAGIQWNKLLLGSNRSKMTFYQDMAVAPITQHFTKQPNEFMAAHNKQRETAPILNLEGLVMDAITKVLGKGIGLAEPLLAAGLDSIGSGEVHTILEKSSRVSLPSTLVFDYPTAASIIELLSEKIPASAPVLAATVPPQMVMPMKPDLSIQEITDIIVECAAKILGSNPEIDVLLMNAGLDSLGVPQLQKELAAAFHDIEIPASLAIDYPTIKSMADYIAYELKQKALSLQETAEVAAGIAEVEQGRLETTEENIHGNNNAPVSNLNKQLLPSDIAIISPLAPKLTKAGYFTVPSIRRLQRMSEQELIQVSRFVIGRQGYGEIAFLYPVDLCNANLDEIVQIERGSITLYNGNKMKTPRPGGGLNQPALLTFKRIFPRVKASKCAVTAFKGVLLQACSRMGATFVHWDPDEGVWIAKVEQF